MSNPCGCNGSSGPYVTTSWYGLPGCGGYGWGMPPMPACNCPPSPEAPWDRVAQSPLMDILVQAGTINLSLPTSYLQAQVPGGPFNVALPNGSYQGQMHQIYIPAPLPATTVTWIVAGTFSGGYTTLTFNGLATSALLAWDGAGWQLTGGNAIAA